MTQTVPEAPLFDRIVEWCLESLHRAGFEIDMGSKLARAFVDAGLRTPTTTLARITGSGPDSPTYGYYTETLRSLCCP